MNNITVQDIQSDNIAELATALSKMQGQLKGAKKDCANPFFKSKYADLTSCWESCREVLEEFGLSVTQTSLPWTDGKLMVTTLLHSSGQFIRSFMPMPYIIPAAPEKIDKYGKVVPPQPERKMNSQEIGSSYTYFRRYSLCGILGICPEDEDGNIASGTQKSTTAIEVIDSSQADYLDNLLQKCDPKFIAAVNHHMIQLGCKTIRFLPKTQFASMKQSIEQAEKMYRESVAVEK